MVLFSIVPLAIKLVIGCGNIPPYKEGLYVYFIDNYGPPGKEYRLRHAHADADTIDPDFARNPTILATFGAPSLIALFNGKKYREIKIEGIMLLPHTLKAFNRDVTLQSLQCVSNIFQILAPDGILIDSSGIQYTLEQVEKMEGGAKYDPVENQKYIEETIRIHRAESLRESLRDYLLHHGTPSDEIDDFILLRMPEFLKEHNLQEKDLKLTLGDAEDIAGGGWLNLEDRFKKRLNLK